MTLSLLYRRLDAVQRRQIFTGASQNPPLRILLNQRIEQVRASMNLVDTDLTDTELAVKYRALRTELDIYLGLVAVLDEAGKEHSEDA